MSKKKIITIFSLLLIGILTVSAISYSIAGLGNGDEKLLGEGATPAAANYVSAIDLIIENSYKDENNTLNIVEIVPSGTAGSDLKRYINDGYFKQYVIDAYSTNGSVMASNTIKYDLVPITGSTKLTSTQGSNILGTTSSTLAEIFNSADLIYLSCPYYTAYNDKMSEEVYDYLHTYASGKNKPLIMDYVKETDTEGSLSNKTYGALISEIQLNFIRYKTFPWGDGYTALQFFKNQDAGKGKSHYLPFTASTRTYKALVISNTSGSTIEKGLKDDYSGDAAVRTKAYYGTETPAANLDVTVVTTANVTVSLLEGDYDFIGIESNVKSENIPSDIYTVLKSKSETGKYIFYGTDRAIDSGSDSNYSASNNYLKLMSLLMTANGLTRQQNVLSVRYGFFTSLYNAGANGLDTAKQIADLFNNSDYRGSSTNGGSRKYRVLEIEPCYPIDLDLARSLPNLEGNYKGFSELKGRYYSIPDQVMKGVTKDEIQDGTEYYAFSISKAKIAKALNMSYNEIEVEQMSVNELISSKEVLAETYDLIYIGGDFSAYVPNGIMNLTQSTNYASNQDHNTLKNLFTCFDMYTHTGVLMPLSLYNGGSPFGEVVSGQTVAAYSGHDLNSLKYAELQDYMEAGLPIMIDNSVTTAYDNMESMTRLQKLAQTIIDPNSYMYQFLADAKAWDSDVSHTNIGWGDIEVAASGATQIIKNENAQYGNTLIQVPDGPDAGAPGVTVFKQAYNDSIKALVDASSKRPYVVIDEAPSQYDQNDLTTVHSESSFSVKASVTGSASSYDFYLLVDENGDGIFEDNGGVVDAESECKAKSSGKTVTLSYDLEEDFFGLISWKVVARSSDNGKLCDAKSGAAFFKLDSEAKKECRVLQVMPINTSTTDYNWNAGHTLYFCTECQQSMKRLQYNVTINGFNQDSNPGLNSATDTSTVNGVYVGLHEHNFGIVKYDSAKENDDWEDNFANILTHGADGTLETGDFSFDLDIVSPAEFDTLCAAAAGRTASEVTSNKTSADQLYEQYQTQLASPTLLTAEETLKTQLYTVAALIDSRNITGKGRAAVIVKNIGTADAPGQWMIDKDYYKFWEYCNSSADDVLYGNISGSLGDLKTAYDAYIKEYDKAVELKNQYKKYSQAAGDASNWIANNYDIVVLGFAEEFGGKDISTVSASQLKTYVNAGGSVLNTHDTMARSNSKGAVNLTATLLDTFGMDRFHVTGVETGTAAPSGVAVSIGNDSRILLDANNVTKTYKQYKLGLFTADKNNATWVNSGTMYTANKDMTYTIKKEQYNNNLLSWSGVVGADHSASTDFSDTTIKVVMRNYDDSPMAGGLAVLFDNGGNVIAQATADASGVAEFKLSPTLSGTGIIDKLSQTIGTYEKCNMTANITIASSGITVTNVDTATTPLDATAQEATVKLHVTNAATIPSGTSFTLKIGKETYSATINADGDLIYTVPVAAFASKTDFNDAINDAKNSTTKYVKYTTGKDYAFFTENLIADGVSNYATEISNNSTAGSKVKYNTPIGVTDYFVSGDSASNPTSPYRYAYSSGESYDHAVNTDGWNMEAKYGTRRASKVNQGGITTYPFAVSDELLISATHAQYFTLDLDDPNVNVWYTLGANFVDGGNPDAQFARYDSSFFAASPHDGMNNYFLYSKNNVFYTGAGHMVVTGRLKDNNDERKLFINVIVNSVNKGISKPKIKLYNVCPTTGDGNCEHEYVNPSNVDANKKLAKETNKVYYNASTKMYQYNIEDGQEHIFPTFDFKAVAGSADLKEIQVFWDLNYGTEPGLNTSDMYEEDGGTNHVMIFTYSGINAANQSGVRMKLRDTMTNLELLDRYMNNYNNFSYIVIYVKDQNNNVKVARIKINVIPHLFDLTDAGFDYQKMGISTGSTVVDITDRTKFYI